MVRIPVIYTFSAYNLDGHRVCVLVDWDTSRYSSAIEQARVENYDKHHLCVLRYCPVWAADAYKVHRKWLELKAHVPFEVLDPFLIGESVVLKLKVARIVRDHDPFKAYAFQWGNVSRASIDMCPRYLMESSPRYVSAGDNIYHARRIAWLATHPSQCADPIDVYSSATRRLFVENGNHRLAAALIRGDADIAVRLYGHGIYDGMTGL